jgi:hypothetical protein
MRRTADCSDTLPETFASVEDAAEWWDSHSAADDWESTTQIAFEYAAGAVPHVVVIEPELAEKLTEASASRGISLETLVNLWLQEKLQATRTHPLAADAPAS